MNTSIKCIHCGKDIEISEAIHHQISETILAEERKKHKEEIEKLEIAANAKALEKVKIEFEEKNKEKNAELEEEKKRNKELQETMSQLAKQKKEEEEKIREAALKEGSEKARLERLEFEKKINDMQKALEDAQRKGKQGSQQLQGEVLELDLEEQLKSNFPQDEFLPIPKGVEGGDIWQKVIDRQGKEVGSILWETKRTKNWDKKWLPKLREDTRRVNGSDSILVSEILPNEIKSFHNIDKVWVTNYEFALHVARIVRFLLLKMDAVKSSASHQDDELKEIFQYITSDAFRHKIEAHDEAIRSMREDLDSEIRLTQTRWKRRETQLKRLDSSVSQLYGELQGIIPTLPDRIANLLPELTDED